MSYAGKILAVGHMLAITTPNSFLLNDFLNPRLIAEPPKETLSMEIVRTMHGLKYCVMSTFPVFDGKEFVTMLKKPITLPMFEYTPAGKEKCKQAFHRMRDELKKRQSQENESESNVNFEVV